MRRARLVFTQNRIMTKWLLFIAFAFLMAVPARAQDAPPLPGVFYLEIRQIVQPEEFPRKSLRVYRLQGQSFQLLIEGFNDPEAEASVEHVLSKVCYNDILQEAERNRLMELGTDCQVYTPVARPKLRTELEIQYKGETKICYSFDKPFGPAIEGVLQAINKCIPHPNHRIIIPRRTPQLEPYQGSN